MLYVEGTFYNNYTGGEEGAAPRRDLSAPIREFCTQHGISAPPPDPSQPLAESERPQVRRAASGRSLADLSTQHSNAGPMYPFRTSTMQVRNAECLGSMGAISLCLIQHATNLPAEDQPRRASPTWGAGACAGQAVPRSVASGGERRWLRLLPPGQITG